MGRRRRRRNNQNTDHQPGNVFAGFQKQPSNAPQTRQCPHDPRLTSKTIGEYACPSCGLLVVAGTIHDPIVKIRIRLPDGVEYDTYDYLS